MSQIHPTTTVFTRNKQAAYLGSRRIKWLFSFNALVDRPHTHFFPLHDKQVYLEIPAKESVA